MLYVRALNQRPLDFLDASLREVFKGARNELANLASPILANIQEYEDKFTLSIPLPGVPKENIDLSMKSGVLTVSVKAEEVKESEKVDEKNGTFVLKEVKTFNSSRNFNFGEDVSNEVVAKLENGVLSLTVQKVKIEEVVKKIEIK